MGSFLFREENSVYNERMVLKMKRTIFLIWSHAVMTLFGIVFGWVSCDITYKVVLSKLKDERGVTHCSYTNYRKEP